QRELRALSPPASRRDGPAPVPLPLLELGPAQHLRRLRAPPLRPRRGVGRRPPALRGPGAALAAATPLATPRSPRRARRTARPRPRRTLGGGGPGAAAQDSIR